MLRPKLERTTEVVAVDCNVRPELRTVDVDQCAVWSALPKNKYTCISCKSHVNKSKRQQSAGPEPAVDGNALEQEMVFRLGTAKIAVPTTDDDLEEAVDAPPVQTSKEAGEAHQPSPQEFEEKVGRVRAENEQLVARGAQNVKFLPAYHYRIFRLAGMGKPPDQIAIELGLQSSTVTTSMTSIVRILGISKVRRNSKNSMLIAIWRRYEEMGATKGPV